MNINFTPEEVEAVLRAVRHAVVNNRNDRRKLTRGWPGHSRSIARERALRDAEVKLTAAVAGAPQHELRVLDGHHDDPLP